MHFILFQFSSDSLLWFSVPVILAAGSSRWAVLGPAQRPVFQTNFRAYSKIRAYRKIRAYAVGAYAIVSA
jgi:hypothetical protein